MGAASHMETLTELQPFRLQFIDLTRGVIMMIMAWDHVSGFWNQYHHGGEGILGRAPAFINTQWFLLRFVSHVCAPTFICIAGTVLAISVSRRLARGDTQMQVTKHLILRGVILLFLEAAFVSPAFSNPWTYFGVIACIGACLIIFSVARRLPTSLILVGSLIIVLGHSFINLDFIPYTTNWGWYLRVILHEPNYDKWPYIGLYPIIPWIGVMGLGWSFGSYLLKTDQNALTNLKKRFAAIGVLSLLLFVGVRWLNGYGNLLPRKGNTLVDWLYVSKYPPDLAFLLWTWGIMFLIMTLGMHLEKLNLLSGRFTNIILVFGRNALFFYLVHLWLYRLNWPSFTPGAYTPPFYRGLGETILFWAVGLVVLWQLCIRYEKLKHQYPKPILQFI